MIGVLLLALPVGLLIGTIGVGGVLLPPALVHLHGFDIHAAAGTSSWCFLFTGVVGTLVHARGRAMPWPLVGRLTLGAAPGAALGALANGLVSATAVWLLLGAITLGAGTHRLLNQPHRDHTLPGATTLGAGAHRLLNQTHGDHTLLGAGTHRSLNRSGGDHTLLPTGTAVTTGALVGFGSALTGTGGPVLLVPVLLVLNVAPLAAVAASQVIQLPLVVFAVLGYAATGSVHFGLGTVLGLVAAVGTTAGALVAKRLPARRLRTIAATTLVTVGVFLLALPLA